MDAGETFNTSHALCPSSPWISIIFFVLNPFFFLHTVFLTFHITSLERE